MTLYVYISEYIHYLGSHYAANKKLSSDSLMESDIYKSEAFKAVWHVIVVGQCQTYTKKINFRNVICRMVRWCFDLTLCQSNMWWVI